MRQPAPISDRDLARLRANALERDHFQKRAIRCSEQLYAMRLRAEKAEVDLAAAREQAEALVRALIELRDVLARTIGLRCGRSRMVQIIGDAVTSYRKANPKVAVCVRCGKPFTITNETRRCPECAAKIGTLIPKEDR